MSNEVIYTVSRKMKSRVWASFTTLLVAMFLLASCPKNYGYGPFEALGSAGKLSEMISETGASTGIYVVAIAFGQFNYVTNSSWGAPSVSRSSAANFFLHYQNKSGSSYTGLANDTVELYYSETPTAMYTTNTAGNSANFLGTVSLTSSLFNSTTSGSLPITLTVQSSNMNRLTASKVYYVGAKSRINGTTYSLPAAEFNLAKITVGN